MAQSDPEHRQPITEHDDSDGVDAAQATQAVNPAVGLVAHDDTTVLENVYKATKHDLATYLITPDAENSVTTIARELGAHVFGPPEPDASETELREYLAMSARSNSEPGLIVPGDSTNPIDFERSLEAVDEDTYVNDAISSKRADNLDVLVAIPAYNEAAAIGSVIQEARQYTDQIIVIDDGSTDDTVSVAEHAGATVVEHTENKGYGGALRTAFIEARTRGANHLVILDGDGQHDPSDIPQAVQTQEETDADIVIGSRFEDESETELPLYRRFGLLIVNTLTNVSMGVVRRKSWVKDTQSGFRTYNRNAIESLSRDDSIGEGMSASTDILYHAHEHGYGLEEIGTTIDYDVDDPSSHNPVSHGLTLVSNILKTIERERPILSLGVPGFTSTLLGLGFGYWTFSNFINSGTFPMGIALTSAFFGLAGIFACFTAIILHSLNQQFE